MSLFFRPNLTEGDLHSIFKTERARFAKVFPRVAEASLVVIDRECPRGYGCALRDYARCDVVSLQIEFSRRGIKELTRANLIGILRHELGHLADPIVTKLGAEQRADDIAAYVTGERIYYDENDVQTLRHGKYPRPRYLHR